MKVSWQNGGLYFEPENGHDNNLIGHLFDMACACMSVSLTAVGMPDPAVEEATGEEKA